MLAALLGWPQGTFASKIAIEGESVSVTREVDGGLQTVKLKGPAIVTTDLRLNEPRFVKLPEIMKAKTKPLTTLSFKDLALAELGGAGSARVKVQKTEPPAARQRGIMVKDTAGLFAELSKRGLV
jgi:electron transfer flavoprotein beta subunit